MDGWAADRPGLARLAVLASSDLASNIFFDIDTTDDDERDELVARIVVNGLLPRD